MITPSGFTIAKKFVLPQNRRMGNKIKFAEGITIEQLRTVADDLAHMQVTIEEAIRVAEMQPEKRLAIYNFSSAKAGLARLKSFVNACDRSCVAARLGEPLQPGQPRPRSKALIKTAKKQARKK